MQEPFSPDAPDEKPTSSATSIPSSPYPAQPKSGREFSVVSQMQMASLQDHVRSCREDLAEIRRQLDILEFHEDQSANFKRIAEHLKNFYLDADSWGFDSLCTVAFALQTLLMDCGNRSNPDSFWEALNRGLSRIAVLLDEWERDFQSRMTTAEGGDYINDVKRGQL
jgi:hypothetical protein